MTAEPEEALEETLQPAPVSVAEPEVAERADADHKAKTTLPRIAGGYRLRPRACCTRPDEQHAVDADELKLLAQVLRKVCEFDVRGQVTQINPGPVVTTFEFKPEAGIKYSRITGLTRRSVPGAESGEHTDRAHGGQIDRRHTGAQP